jgi:predicted enzyme related to lactoylglutathione lyase
VNLGVRTILYPVTDLAAAKTLFSTLLGIEPQSDAPYYVGYQLDDQQIGLVPNGHQQGMTGPVAHYHVSDIAQTLQALQGAGGRVTQEPRDVGGGRLVAIAADADGNSIGLIQDPNN